MSLRNIFTPLISMVAGGTQMETLSITFGVGEHAAKLAYGSFCLSEIDIRAIRCPFCTSELDK